MPVLLSSSTSAIRFFVLTSNVVAASSKIFDVCGNGCSPQTTRNGLAVNPGKSPRGIKCGSSVMTVLVPTKIASACLRSNCTSLRDFSFEIHLELPSVAAIFPSRVVATFHVKNGRFFSIFVSHALFA